LGLCLLDLFVAHASGGRAAFGVSFGSLENRAFTDVR
jgi:hypothetical protein